MAIKKAPPSNPENRSKAEILAALPEDARNHWMDSLSKAEAEALENDWSFFGRPNQFAPGGTWKTWLILAGRGFGKTRAGAEWVRSMVCGDTPLARGKCRRVALIGETAKDTRDVMVEGDSGILGVHPKDFRPNYEPSKARLTWPNGAEATMYNATEPDQLRGPQFDCAWLDELAKWDKAQETYDMLQFCLRLGDDPRQIVTTTPRPTDLVKMLIKDPMCITTKGSTYDNRANLAPSFIKEIESRYEGTRLGRQELYADLLLDMPGSLWKQDMVDRNRVQMSELPEFERIVVAIDPAIHLEINAVSDQVSETGIVVVGKGVDGLGYVLDDATCREMPDGWARKAIAMYDKYEADRIIAETNQGGLLVEHTIRSQRDYIPFQHVKASRGKITRAEPVSALYEQNRIKHVGRLIDLENQMMTFVPGTKILAADRVDALVWGITSLFPSFIVKRRGEDIFSGDDMDVQSSTNEFGFFK